MAKNKYGLQDGDEIIATFFDRDNRRLLGSDGTYFTGRKTERGVRMFLCKNRLVPSDAAYASFTRIRDWGPDWERRLAEAGRRPLETLGLLRDECMGSRRMLPTTVRKEIFGD